MRATIPETKRFESPQVQTVLAEHTLMLPLNMQGGVTSLWQLK